MYIIFTALTLISVANDNSHIYSHSLLEKYHHKEYKDIKHTTTPQKIPLPFLYSTHQ